MRYAQINPVTKKCFAVSYHVVDSENAILLTDDNLDPHGMVYHNGKWIKSEEEVQPSQLDRIEGFVSKSYEEYAQTAIDEYTLQLVEGGIL